jgi:multimeric flavodoxin WrbA
MNILLINGSPRKRGNTEIMADAFLEGARGSGNTATMINLSETKVNPCNDCEYCFVHDGTCVQQDGMTQIYAALDKAGMVVFVSPIYYFCMTAQIEAVIDRLYARLKTGYHVTNSALLLDSNSPGVFTAAVAQYRDMLSFLNWKEAAS